MRPLGWLMLVVVVASCRSDGPRVDANGCWDDGEEAFEAWVIAVCDWNMACDDVHASHEACVEELHTNAVEFEWRTQTCFDGCVMDACLDESATAVGDCELSMPSCTQAFESPVPGRECAQVGW